MKLVDYSLKINNKQLFENVNVTFNSGINHLLGSNGVGKSCFAKSMIGLLKYSGNIEVDTDITIIGSYTGIPQDYKLLDIKK